MDFPELYAVNKRLRIFMWFEKQSGNDPALREAFVAEVMDPYDHNEILDGYEDFPPYGAIVAFFAKNGIVLDNEQHYSLYNACTAKIDRVIVPRGIASRIAELSRDEEHYKPMHDLYLALVEAPVPYPQVKQLFLYIIEKLKTHPDDLFYCCFEAYMHVPGTHTWEEAPRNLYLEMLLKLHLQSAPLRA
jgi:hypothetical protein